VKAWVEAFNKGDVDSALAFFTDSATAMGYFQAGSKAELRMSFQWLAGMEAKLGAPDCKPGGGGLMCSFTYTDGCVAAAGITDGMGLRGTIDIQPDGKIRKAPLAADGEGWGKYALWNNKFEAWARANHADSWIKRDRLEFQPERVKLCKEYAESLKAAPTLAADLTAPVKAWADALNKGDVEAALAPLADNVWWKASYQASEMGKEAVRQVFTYLAGMETKQQIKECRQEADRVTCTVSITDGCIAAFGAPDGLPAELEFKFGDDGKIVESSMTADDPRWQERANFTGAVVAWASANRAEDFVKAEEDTIEAGSTLVKLCQEYAESLK
jgi:hypothetical protein